MFEQRLKRMFPINNNNNKPAHEQSELAKDFSAQ
jgi:hypothetical protein